MALVPKQPRPGDDHVEESDSGEHRWTEHPIVPIFRNNIELEMPSENAKPVKLSLLLGKGVSNSLYSVHL